MIRRLIRYSLLLILAAILAAVFYGGHRALGVLTGYSAKRVCSEVFVAGRDPEHWTELSFLPLSSRIELNRTEKTATSHKWGVETTAVWREGLGCAITPATPVEAVRAQAFERHSPPPASPLPGRTPAQAGIDAAALNAAMDALFAPGPPDNPYRTRAVIVLHDGHVIAERYGDGFGPDTTLLGWSMTKSVTHALIGAAVLRGLIETDRTGLFPHWEGDARAAISLDDLLKMASGLEWSEGEDPFSDLTKMLYLRPDTARVAARADLAAEPGTEWQYSSGTTNMISAVLRRALGDAAYHRFPYEALFDPLGAGGAVMEADASGTFVGSSYLYMTAREWARFGQLYLNDGVWEGRRLLPPGWAGQGCAPTAVAPEGIYGRQWWVNGAKADGSGRFEALPPGTCMALGHEAQFLVLVPERDLVIVRLGLTFGDRRPMIETFGKIVDAVPAPPPAP